MDDHLRASDADRDAAAGQLRAHYVAGRLTREELGDRLAAALGAATLGDLGRISADLPAPAPARPETIMLERRYRRLLALYPEKHRRDYGEEMLAVLLTSAPAGRCRPGLAGTADLIAGALRVRFQAVLRRKLGWRGAAGLVGAGAVAGLLAGLPFASVSRPPAASQMTTASVYARFPFLSMSLPAAPAAERSAGAEELGWMTAAAGSDQFLAQAARTVTPSMSSQALRQRLAIDVSDGGSPGVPGWAVAVISVRMGTVQQARSVAAAVAETYIRVVNDKHFSQTGTCAAGVTCTLQVRATSVKPGQPDYVTPVSPEYDPRQPPAAPDAAQSSALGALFGALIAAIAGMALMLRGRRYRMT